MDPVALPFQAELVVCLTVALPSKAELGGVGAVITVRLEPGFRAGMALMVRLALP